MVAKRLTCMHIADVQLQQRNACALDRIHQSNAGMCISPSIEDQACQLILGMQLTCFVDPVNQLTFMIALVKAQRQAMTVCLLLAQLLHIGQRLRAVNRRFTCTQQIEIGAIEDKNRFCHCKHSERNNKAAIMRPVFRSKLSPASFSDGGNVHADGGIYGDACVHA